MFASFLILSFILTPPASAVNCRRPLVYEMQGEKYSHLLDWRDNTADGHVHRAWVSARLPSVAK